MKFKFLSGYTAILVLCIAALAMIFIWWWNFSNSLFPLESEVNSPSGSYSLSAKLPIERTESGGISCNGKFYILGGIDAFMRTFTSFMEYTPETDSWKSLPDLPEPINHPAVVSFQNKIYVIGGFEPLGLRIRWFMFARWDALNTVYIFDITSQTWSKGNSMPEPRGAGGATVCDSALWYVGGIDQERNITASLFRMDLKTGLWQKMPSMSIPRDHLRMESVGNKLYAISGRKDDLRLNISALECFDIATGTWSKKAEIPIARGGFSSAVLNGFIYTFGGEYVWTCLDEVERYNPATDTWEVLSPLPEGRHGIVSGVIGNEIHLVSGGRHPRLSISGIHRVFKPKE